MGGSCPSCRAPVDLGQEFCLECGAPIRFTPRQRQKRRRTPAADQGAAVPAARRPRGSGFPWVPFLIVLALVGGGVALALVDSGSKGSSGPKATTEPALPSITSEPPTTSASETRTVTLEDCDPSRPFDGTQPAIDDTGLDPNEEVPELDESFGSSADNGFSDSTPSIEPNEPSPAAGSVTVDQNGSLCDPDATSDAGSDPGGTDTSPTSGTSTRASASGDWPSDRDGWTVIIAGYPDQARAQQRSADVQEDGFDDAGVLFSSDFRSLCPGFYVVFSGVFSSEAQARRHSQELSVKPDYAGTYVREIRTSGSAAPNCTPAN